MRAEMLAVHSLLAHPCGSKAGVDFRATVTGYAWSGKCKKDGGNDPKVATAP
jgi:hypothetical protein